MAILAAFTVLFAEKSSGKTRSVHYVIIAKNPFKTNIDALQAIKFSKNIIVKIFVYQPYS